MYVSQVLSAMTEGFSPESLQFNQIPSSLETYYQQHWQKMITANQNEEFSQAVLNVLVKQQQPTSVEAVAEIMNADEFDVEEVLENWFEFLHQQELAGEKYYNFYHSSFRKWLAKKI
ncbi:hypothetical protein LC593_03230 [Nostoc sp. CHAB 5844]|nr:hypothetical protein [Nostoc sp. CHAB 5844]